MIAVAAVAIFLIWYFAIRDSGGDTSEVAGSSGLGPVATNRTDLVEFSRELDEPVYWAGERPGADMELTQTQDGNIYVRYLTGGGAIGNAKPNYLTVGTYPFPDAYHALKVIADRPGGIVDRAPDGGLVVTNENSPTSVYLAYRDQDVQVEVYDPDPKEALDQVTSGSVVPVR